MSTPHKQAAAFKFIHAADLHIDSPMRGLVKHDDAPEQELRGATRAAVENLIDLALQEQIDFLLLAGDIYDGDWQDMSTGLFFNRQMSRLAQANIPVYMIRGNHDARSVISKKLTLPDNVHDFPTRSASTQIHETLPLAIHGRGFANRSVDENLVPGYPDPLPGHFNIGLLHTSLAGSDQHDTYAPCSLEQLKSFGYDYWALGHIHQREILSTDPWVIFSGNTQGRHVRETGERGCYLVNVDARGECQCRFHTLDVARWFNLFVDLTAVDTEEELLGRMKEQFVATFGEDPIQLLAIRISLQGQTLLSPQLRLNTDRWLHEFMALAEQLTGSRVWIESVRVETQVPVAGTAVPDSQDLIALVQQKIEPQPLTELLQPTEWPEDVAQMLRSLSKEQKHAVADLLGMDLEVSSAKSEQTGLDGEVADRQTALAASVFDTVMASLYTTQLVSGDINADTNDAPQSE